MDTRLGNLLEQAGLACNSTEAPAAETAPGAEEESHGLTAYTPFISVRACGRLWRLQRAADLETLWNAMLDDPQNFEDERLPYWTELWPSSIALCRWLEERRAEIAGRPCLDLGCGLGLTAMVGQWLGAQVIGMDYEEEALHFASLNARHNGVTSPLWTVMDWRQPAVRPRSIFRLWGGDIMYEKRFVAPVMHFLSHVLADDGAAWVAEPGRGVYEAFLQALHGGGLEGRRVFTERVEPLYAQPVPVTVAVWEIRRRVRISKDDIFCAEGTGFHRARIAPCCSIAQRGLAERGLLLFGLSHRELVYKFSAVQHIIAPFQGREIIHQTAKQRYKRGNEREKALCLTTEGEISRYHLRFAAASRVRPHGVKDSRL